MKSVKEISAIISKLTSKAYQLEKRGGELLDEAKKISNGWSGSRFSNIKESPEYTRWEQLHQDANKAYSDAVEVKEVIAVWKFNLMHAKKAELLPAWCEVMRDYEGKQIGRSREDEIRGKLKARGVSGYISQYEYSTPKIHLSFLDKNGCCYGSDYVELSGNYQIKFYDENNKFHMPELKSFTFYGEGTPYIENPKQYIRQLKRLAEKAKKTAAVYSKALGEYNAAAVPGFAQIDVYKEAPYHVADYFKIDL